MAGLLTQPSIHNILKMLEEHKILIPLIQRPFRWREDRMTMFMDSIIKKMPVGMILLYRHDESFELFGRPIFKDFNEYTQNMQYKYETRVDSDKLVVLDGHQRLQTLLIVSRGSYKGGIFYHNIRCRTFQRLHECSFIYRKHQEPVIRQGDSLWMPFKTLVSIAEELARPDYIMLEPREAFDKFMSILHKHKIESYLSDEEKGLLFDYVRGLKDMLFSPHYRQEIMPINIVEHVGLDRLLEIFVRYNSGGLRLSKSDLLFSVIKPRWRAAEADLNELSSNTGIDKDLLLKALIVVSGMSPTTSIYDAVKRIDLLKNNFPQFKAVIELLRNRIHELTPLPERILRKFNFLIPVVMFFFNNTKLLRTKRLVEMPDIVEYILIIVYNSRLRSDRYLAKIIEEVKKGGDTFPAPDIKRLLETYGVKTKIDGVSLNRDPCLTLSLIVRREEWRPLIYRRRLHIDHIFPKHRAKELPEGARLLIDSIWNKYVVFEGDNLSKGEKLPEEHFVGEKERLLDYYILPRENKSLLKKEYADKCLAWRIKRIKQLFKERLGIEIEVSKDLEILGEKASR